MTYQPKVSEAEVQGLLRWFARLPSRPDTITANSTVMRLAAEWRDDEARLERIDDNMGTVCEASGYVRRSRTLARDCGPVEYHDNEGIPLCADCYQEAVEEFEEREAEEKAEVPRPSPQKNGDGHAYKPPLGLCANCGTPRYLHAPPAGECKP